MVRNLNNRIEVATPIFDPEIQQQLRKMLDIQLSDNVKARLIGPDIQNQYKKTPGPKIRSQVEIYNYLKNLV
jgi:polyphosphate kinase